MTRVLIADDQAQNRYMLEVLLKSLGYEVVSASNGAEALELAKEAPPDLIVSDILMPVMDGFALCHQWRSDETLKDIPFIFYTATYTESKDEKFALSLGADRYILKPAEPDVVTRAVNEVLEEYQDRKLVASRGLSGEELEFFRHHNEALIAKLEHKMATLESANRELRRETAEHARAEARVVQLNATLEARILERTAELSAANSELAAFSHSVSHDLRAPLRRINAWSQVLLEECGDKLDDAAKGHLLTIRGEVQSMSELIEALLRLARVTGGDLEREPVDMVSVAGELRAALRREEPERDVELVLAPDMDAVNADPRLVRDLLENLLSNAWKFTKNREHARVELGVVKTGGRRAFFVRDNGAGFNMAYASKLFQTFRRLHPKEDFPGIGVGLATVQRIVHRHGGEIWAEGEEGKGATFYFTLGPGSATRGGEGARGDATP